MKKLGSHVFLSTLVVLATLTANAEFKGIHLCQGFAGLPSLGIPKSTKKQGGITEAQFNEVLNKIQTAYEDDFKARGAKLKINRLWKRNDVNALAHRSGSTWEISMFGGLARRPGMTADGFALVACHEIGHHIGGAPHVFLARVLQGDQMSVEGQSDYFATLKCARRIFANDDNEAVVAKLPKSSYLEKECSSEFSSRKDQLICIRSAKAGFVLANELRELKKQKQPISFQTPDLRSPKFFSKQLHPRAQCRLDTYLNGARCPVPESEAVSNDSYWPGTCDRAGEGVNTGSRPRCWFKPTQTMTERF